MFITIYKCDTSKPAVCRALLDMAEMHRQVQYLFNSKREDFRTLYRLDQGYLIVQSDIKPMCDGIFEMAAQYDMDEKLDSWEEGKQLRFRIRTVPRVSIHSKKHYIKDSGRRIEWLGEQLGKRGMKLLSARENRKADIKVSSKTNARTNSTLKLSTWEYEGVLSITDKNAFLDGYKQGIGSQKAYGCGMICFCG